MKKMIMLGTIITLLSIGLIGCAMNKSLHIPASKGDLAQIKSEINKGTDVNSKDIAGQTALMYASEAGNLEVVEYLIEHDANVNAQSGNKGRGTPLIYAASKNKVKVMEYLLENGANINSTTHHHETALFWAAAFGHMSTVNLLLNNNADITITNNEGKTALDIAKELNKEEIVQVLSGYSSGKK